MLEQCGLTGGAELGLCESESPAAHVNARDCVAAGTSKPSGYVAGMGCDIHVVLERRADDGLWRGEHVRFGRDYEFFATIAGQSLRGLSPLRGFTPNTGWPADMSPQAYNMGFVAIEPPDHSADENEDAEERSRLDAQSTWRSNAESWVGHGDHWGRRLGDGTVVYSRSPTLPGGGWRVTNCDLHTWVWLDADQIHDLAAQLDARTHADGTLWLPDGMIPTENEEAIPGAVRTDQRASRTLRSIVDRDDSTKLDDAAFGIVYTAVYGYRREEESPVGLEDEIPATLWRIPERPRARTQFAELTDDLPAADVRMIVAFDN